jgi:hypothetical protein
MKASVQAALRIRLSFDLMRGPLAAQNNQAEFKLPDVNDLIPSSLTTDVLDAYPPVGNRSAQESESERR